MFEGSCSQPIDPNTTACGLFSSTTETPGFLTLTLSEFLDKLDLAEYKEPFENAGITNVEKLAALSDADLDAFHLRKLEKRKLLHHLTKARAAENTGSLSCTS